MYGDSFDGLFYLIRALIVIAIMSIFLFIIPLICAANGLILSRLVTGEWLGEWAKYGGIAGFAPAVILCIVVVKDSFRGWFKKPKNN